MVTLNCCLRGAFGLVLVLAGVVEPVNAQRSSSEAVAIDGDDIGGVVRSPSGPEAGVWVIAETTELPTKFARIVVTDDQGRYVIPDLPKARYKVWVRGYGLVDSPKADGEPGKLLNLSAVVAPNEAAAAQYYPAIFWYSMMNPYPWTSTSVEHVLDSPHLSDAQKVAILGGTAATLLGIAAG